MEFIPLERTDGKKRRKKADTSPRGKEGISSRNSKEVKKKGDLRKPPPGKNVKNQYKEKILERRAQKSLMKKNKKRMMQEKEGEKDSVEEESGSDGGDGIEKQDVQSEIMDMSNNENDMEDDSEGEGDTEEDGGEAESDSEEDEEKKEEEKREKAKKEKWRQLDEKKKNRLFLKMKKRIHSESQIKELHPDIKGVIFPRKKNPKWCWAVFKSEESANNAFGKLAKNRDILVSKPNTREQVELKREKKLATVKRKEQAKKKHLKMWT